VSNTKARLDRVAQTIGARAGVRVAPLARVGNPLEQIRAVVQDADLMVVGAKSGNPLRAFVLGTPAERLLRLFRLPVLLARKAVTGAYRHILVPTDLGASSRHQLHAATRLFPAAGIHLFHALTGGGAANASGSRLSSDGREVPPVPQAHDEGLRALKSLTVVAGGSKASLTIAEGDPSLLSLQRQEAVRAELIVIGKDGQSSFGEYLLGRVAQRILARATCDVLVTPRIAMQRTT
jgi:nucleotide-binding universal stress UspA family protein